MLYWSSDPSYSSVIWDFWMQQVFIWHGVHLASFSMLASQALGLSVVWQDLIYTLQPLYLLFCLFALKNVNELKILGLESQNFRTVKSFNCRQLWNERQQNLLVELFPSTGLCAALFTYLQHPPFCGEGFLLYWFSWHLFNQETSFFIISERHLLN